MKSIPTAEELINTSSKLILPEYIDSFNRKEVKELMIEFAKLYVQAALEAATERVRNSHQGNEFTADIYYAYSLNNIK